MSIENIPNEDPFLQSEQISQLRIEFEEASAELKTHMASWEFAFAMGDSHHGGANHPTHLETREKTEKLVARYNAVKARIAEFVL
jgi:hypothetical protein